MNPETRPVGGAIERPSSLHELLGLCARPDLISFALGLPGEESFPTSGLAAAAGGLIDDDPSALQYGVPCEALARHIVELMHLRGVACRQEQVVLTAGAQQGIDFAARLLCPPGGRVVLEETVYSGVLRVLEMLRAEITTVPTDPHRGLDLDALEGLLADGLAPAMIYTIACGHNPMGVSLSPDARRRLIGLARRYRMPVIEDDAYGFLYYDAEPHPPLRAFDENWVVYLGSFSKILAPGLRLGWMIVPERFEQRLEEIKQASDHGLGTFAQHLVARYLSSAPIEDHLASIRRRYRRRRDAMLGALERSFPPGIRWTRPASGMFIWVELPPAVDAVALLLDVVDSEKVAFCPGEAFAVPGGAKAASCFRLSFSYTTVDAIEQGIPRLARALGRFLDKAA